jgi:hypothetical protein
VLGRWRHRGRLTCGVYLVSDGREALILAPRRDVDPAFGGQAHTRDVVFEVATPAQYAAGDSATARLVAVYINNQDLALLRAPSPSDQAFVTPVAPPGSLAAGDAAALLAVPAGAALQTQRAEVIQPGAGGSTDVLTPIALQLPPGAQPRPAVAFTLSGARLIGVVRGALDRRTDPPIVTAAPASGVLRPLHWAHLIEQGRTEMLLQRLRDGQ